MIRKFCNNYVSVGDISSEADEATLKYEKIINDIENCRELILQSRNFISKIENDLITIEEKKNQLENEYKISGGLTDEEKEKLLDDSKENEKIKSITNTNIKSFVDNMLPFIIAGDNAKYI